MTAAAQRSRRNWLLRLLLLIFAGLLISYIVICARIARQSSLNEAQPADVIVVFGAAEYYGKPSPVYRARLDHAFDLFDHKLAPVIITTGGYGKEIKFSEGGVGRDYLESRGIGDRHLIAETQGDNSAESAQRVATIMRTNGMKSCIVVTDNYHVFRTKRLLESYGITAYTSPRPHTAPITRWARTQLVMREALSYMLWRMHVT